MRRSVGSKCACITSDQIAEITGLYLDDVSADPAQQPDDRVRMVSPHEPMYRRGTVNQPPCLHWQLMCNSGAGVDSQAEQRPGWRHGLAV